MATFFDRLKGACEAKNSLLCVGLDPRLSSRPRSVRHSPLEEGAHGAIMEAIVSENRLLVEQTLPYAAAYKPNMAFYEAWGSQGLAALEETIRLIPSDVPIILDFKRNDIGSTAAAYAQAAFGHLDVDGVTLSPYLGKDAVIPFLDYKDRGIFVLCRTSNPSAGQFQDLGIDDVPLFLRVAEEAVNWSTQIGLVVAGNDVDALRRVRERFPETWFLAPGIGAQGGRAEEAVEAGCREDGLGLLAVVSRGVSEAAEPGEAARNYRDELNSARDSLRAGRGAAVPGGRSHVVSAGRADGAAAVERPTAADAAAVEPLEVVEPPTSEPPRTEIVSTGTVFAEEPPAVSAPEGLAEYQKRMVLHGLVRTGCFRVGDFVLKSGARSPFYVDLRRTVSDPVFLKLIAQAYAEISRDLDFNRIAGIPMAALPLATAVSLETGVPMIYPRLSAKDHGTGNRIEGEFRQGDRVLLLDDLITSGKSKLEAIEVLRGEGLVVSDLVVLLERSNRARSELEEAGIRVHAYAHVLELFATCRQMGVIEETAEREMREFIEQGN
ncbi:orotidine-5'-phosphate decarboxylase [Salinispira pacifica]